MDLDKPKKVMFKYFLPITGGILLLASLFCILKGIGSNNAIISILGILGAIYSITTIHWASFEEWKNNSERTSNKKSVPKQIK